MILIEQNISIELIHDVPEFYGADLCEERLKAQLTALHGNDTNQSLKILQSIIYFKALSEVEEEFYSEVIKVAKLILVTPATNALSERSFSVLQRIKTWLCTTTAQICLNSCMMLPGSPDETDSMPMSKIANEFIQRNKGRVHIFGHNIL